MREFVEEAARKRTLHGKYAFDVGPDAFHGLKPTLRVLFNGAFRLRLYDAQSLAMASALVEGELPPGVLLDWLKDNQGLGEE